MSNYFDEIFNTFNKQFFEKYSNLKYKNKKTIYSFFCSFYRKWLYSALIKNTTLTPFNILSHINQTSNESSLICPMPKPYKESGILTNKNIKYTLDDHPVIIDLKILLKHCSPDILLDDNDNLNNPTTKLFINKLSISDPFYVDYLVKICFELDLLAKSLSIHSNRAQLTNNFDSFFTQDNKIIFEKIVKASIKVTVFNLRKILPFDNDKINYNFILSLLKEPISCEDIYNTLYLDIGLDMDSIVSIPEGTLLDEVLDLMLNNTFYFGIVIDKYFFTIFGFYLKIINPHYLVPFNLEEDINFSIKTLKETSSLEVSMFCPCSIYSLTSLGLKFFDIKNNVKNNIPENLILDIIKNKLIIKDNLLEQVTPFITYKFSEIVTDTVYLIKINTSIDKNYWKHIEFLDNITLHDLYKEICYEFDFDDDLEYTYYENSEKILFSAITSPNKKRTGKKSADYTIKNILLNEKDTVILTLENVINPFDITKTKLIKYVDIHLQLLKIKKSDYNKLYPYLLRESKAFKDLFDNLNF